MYPAFPAPSRSLRRLSTLTLLFVCGLLLTSQSFAQTTDTPDDFVAVFNQAQDLHEKGDLAGAIELYKKAIRAMPEFPEAEYQCGIAQLALGQNSDAERSFRRAIELRPDWSLALSSLGSVLVQNGQVAEAERTLSKALAFEPQNSSALVAMVDLRLKTKASPAVLNELLDRMINLTSKANPTPSMWSARAALEAALGKSEAAKASMAYALKADPKNRATLLQAVDLALAGGDVVRAKDLAKTFESLSPSSDAAKLINAKILAAEGDTDEAIKSLDSITKPSPSANELRAKIVASNTTNTADLEKQLETNANDPIILGRLCSAYRIPDPQKAVEYCRRASEAEPTNVNHAIGFGAALVQARQFDSAVNVLRKVLAVAPDNSTAHANLATALFESKRYQEAKSEYEWLTAKQPNLAIGFYFLAITHDRLNEYMDASANYQQFLRIADPVANKLEIEKVNLRLPALDKLVKDGKSKKNKK